MLTRISYYVYLKEESVVLWIDYSQSSQQSNTLSCKYSIERKQEILCLEYPRAAGAASPICSAVISLLAN